MAFRYKVSKTVQVKQFEPLVIEAEYSTDKNLTVEAWNKVADRVEDFVVERLKEQIANYKGLEIREKKKNSNVVEIAWEE